MNLSTIAQDKLAALYTAVQEQYGVANAAESFAVTPALAQTLHDKIFESAGPFYKSINVTGVTELKGEKVFIDAGAPVSTRTDTDNNDRVPRDLSNSDNQGYELFSTESDLALKWSTIDAWAHISGLSGEKFQQLYADAGRKRIANDRIICGWYGISAAGQTNPVTNPLLQDLNIGWLQKMRLEAAAQVESDALVIGPAATSAAKNLDEVVNAGHALIEPAFQNSDDLVVVMSRAMMFNAKGTYFREQGSTPTEKEKIMQMNTIQTYGGLPAVVAPFFPDNKLLITSLSNLSIYWQLDSWRRMIENNHKRNRVEDFNSRNEGYVVEEYGKAVLLDNVTFEAPGVPAVIDGA